MFLQDGDLHPGPGEQQAEDHPGRPAAHHTACGPLHLMAPFDVPEAMGTLSGRVTQRRHATPAPRGLRGLRFTIGLNLPAPASVSPRDGVGRTRRSVWQPNPIRTDQPDVR
ncbi:hypothetical protein GCM10009579_41670 [Streptomyces javensis]|uniref:Uncharacterized protein n=1 Tax=Streptomyces javensis TaxID=114698 RepID=A0ABP4HSU0_9ACTN